MAGNLFVVRNPLRILSADSAGTAVTDALVIGTDMLVQKIATSALGLSGYSGKSGYSGQTGTAGESGYSGETRDGTRSSRWMYVASDTTPADQYFSMNTSTFSSVSTIYVNKTSSLNTGSGVLENLYTWINANPNKLLLQITDTSSDKPYGLYSISSASVSSPYITFNVGSVICSSGSADYEGNDYVISFIMEGSSGASGVAPTVATVKYFQNIPWFNDTTTLSVAESTSAVAPFYLPANASFDYIRVMATAAGASTALATTANVNLSAQFASSWYAVIYSRDSANSLQSVASASALFRTTHSLSANVKGSLWTLSRSYEFPVTGGASTLTFAAASVSSASYSLASASITAFTGVKFIDIPLASSLSEGNYWIAVGRASGSSTNATNATGLTRLYATASLYGISQLASTPSVMGSATDPTVNRMLGQGIYTTNTLGGISAIALSQISASTDNNMLSFQLIKNTGVVK